MTRVELTTYGEPKTLLDRFKQRGVHRWMRRQTKKALERLRRIFEEPSGEERRPRGRGGLRAVEGAAVRRARADAREDPGAEG